MNNSKTGLALSSGGLSELWSRLLFVLLGLLIYRLGAYIPVPGLNPAKVSELFQQHQQGILGVFNMFSGGALSRMTLFALGIMPYISASIVVQMYSSISPRLIQLKKEGQRGQRKINQYTRYGTLFLALLQSIGISKWMVSSGVALQTGPSFYIIAVATLVTGTLFLMWLGEQMTERGIGNGISLIIFAGIAARFPASVGQILSQVKQGQMSPIKLLLIIAFILAVVIFVVYFERAQRQIKINYPKRQQGRKMYAAQTSHLPLKINMAGVIPPIFAMSIVGFPVTIAGFFAHAQGFSWLREVALFLQFGSLTNMLVTVFFVVFFSFFYTALTYNPKETADNLKKSGAFIPGIRPGEQTTRYIDSVMTRLTFIGALYLAFITLLPALLKLVWHVPFYFGGTSLLIIVVVLMDFMAQVQSYFMSHQYASLMKKTKLRG